MYTNADVTVEMAALKEEKIILDHRITLLTQTVTIEIQSHVLLFNAKENESKSECNDGGINCNSIAIERSTDQLVFDADICIDEDDDGMCDMEETD